MATVATQNRVSTYSIDSLQRTKLGVSIEENRSHIVVEKKMTHQFEGITTYRLKVTTLTNTTNSTNELRAIENDLKELQKNIDVQVNSKGEIVKVINLPEIRAYWGNFRDDFKRKYRNNPRLVDDVVATTEELLKSTKQFTNNFKETDFATLLFPPLPNAVSTASELKTFPNFFDVEALKLFINNNVSEGSNGVTHLKRIGSLLNDEEYLRSVRSYFTDLFDNYKLLVRPKVDYVETFDFDTDNWVTHAGQILSVDIKNVFQYSQIVRLKTITP